jgi:DNA-binding MarR family transcriptional regulator
MAADSKTDATSPVAVADKLRPALLRLGRLLRREGQMPGISAVDAHLIGLVAKQSGIGVSELAAAERVSSATISVHVKRLVAAGWLQRRQEEGDQRRAPLELGAAGEKALLDIRRSRTDWLAAQLARLDDEERAAIDAATGPLLRLAEMLPSC